MPGIIALILIAIVALAVLSFTVHILSLPGCWWPLASWSGSSSAHAAPTSSPVPGTGCRARFPAAVN